MYLHEPGLTQFSKDWNVTCVNGTLEHDRLKRINARRYQYTMTVLHGYQCYKIVKNLVNRKRLGLLVFVPSNDYPWFSGRNSRAVNVLKPEIILPEQLIRVGWYQRNAKVFSEWFPPACAVDVFKPSGKAPDYDIAFAGTMARVAKYGKRNRWIKALRKYAKVLIRSGVTQLEFCKVYDRGLLGFHMSQFMSEGKKSQGTAYRIFEVGGVGRALLADPSPAIEKLFEDSVHYISYRSWRELIEKVQYFLEHRDEAVQIGANLRREILRAHTYEQRGRRLRVIVEKHV